MKLNHYQSERFIGLHEVCKLVMDLENESIINPKESERTQGFQARVVELLLLHGLNIASLNKLTVGDGVWTVYQYIRSNPEVPWNVLTLLRDWLSVLRETGIDVVDVYVFPEDEDSQGI